MAKFDESKKVSTEEMEQVAGGTAQETAADSIFLNELLRGRPEQPNRYSEFKVRLQNHSQEIVDAWASVGVTCKIDNGSFNSDGGNNVYSINGKEVSRDAACKYAMRMVGKRPNPIPDWN